MNRLWLAASILLVGRFVNGFNWSPVTGVVLELIRTLGLRLSKSWLIISGYAEHNMLSGLVLEDFKLGN